MPYESAWKSAQYPYGGPDKTYLAYSYTHSWNRSPRVNGRLVFRANPWSLSVYSARCTNYDSRGQLYWPGGISFDDGFAAYELSRAQAVAASEARSSFASRAKSGYAGSLGVSIASATQSMDMLRGSAKTLVGILGSVDRFYRASTRKSKQRRAQLRRLVNRGAAPTAGLVLEGFFGWAPLFQDFYTSMQTLSNPWPPGWISVRKSYQVDKYEPLIVVSTPTVNEFYNRRYRASGSVTFSAGVVVTNPNLWLGNKLGLINPASVAWDVIPWSFLAGMVVNVGQLLGSLTDLAGLSLRDDSLTYRNDGTRTYTSRRQVGPFPGDPNPPTITSASGTRSERRRSRSVGTGAPPIVPVVRFPEWNVGTAAILGSLLIQRTNSISHNLLRN